MSSNFVYLQQDNHDKLCVKIPKHLLDSRIKQHFKWRRLSSKYPSWLSRLQRLGSVAYDDFIKVVHKDFGISQIDFYNEKEGK